MKRVIFIFLMIAGLNGLSQSVFYSELKNKLKAEHPEMVTENRLIVLNVWNSNDQKSREANTQLNKAYIAYEWAKLKEGSRGMIGISINQDADKSMEKIVMEKDKLAKVIVMEQGKLDLEGIRNVIFDSNGNVIAKNISSDIFEEIHKLITR